MVSINEVPAATTTTTTTASNGSTSSASSDKTKTSSSMVSPTVFYEKHPEQLKKLCDFLRSRNGPPVREALLMEKRVHYLKGTYAIIVYVIFIDCFARNSDRSLMIF